MKVIWTPQGFELLVELVTYLSEIIGKDKAAIFHQELVRYVKENLSKYPERNPPCNYPRLQAAGYRCLKFKKKYIVIYREINNSIEIIGVVSSKRNPDFFDGLID